MTENQKKFLKMLYKSDNLTSEECCKKLKLEKSYEENTYYSELCRFLPYPNEDDEFDSKVHLMMHQLEEDPFNTLATFSLTAEGREYIEEQSKEQKGEKFNKHQAILTTIATVIAIISLIVMVFDY